MSSSEVDEITQLLLAWSQGDRQAADRLLSLLYDQLRRLANRNLRGERPNHTLHPTDLVHEAYLRLVDQRQVRWESRRHFFAIAARVMRRIVLDHARSYRSVKRGGGRPDLLLDEVGEIALERAPELMALDDALNDLAALDEQRAAVVELRFFGGLSLEETAEVVGRSRATIIRQWRSARAWLIHQLSQER